MTANAPTERRQLQARSFPSGIPTLWCPTLTHYDSAGAIDRERIAAHVRYLSTWVKGWLIPGSTGDGWELSDREAQEVLDVALEQATSLSTHLLIGVLKTDADAMRQTLLETLAWLKGRAGSGNDEQQLAASRVCGFTICPPKGDDLSQAQIEAALGSILEMGLPTALYQLPQVTGNEMSPELVSRLAASFGNFFLFKDTSGKDRVALSGLALEEVFLVRGAEGDYARWLKASGGPYHGFLLSTANCFAREFHTIIEHLNHHRAEPARELSGRVTDAVDEVFQAVADLREGNPFANANKAIDHFFAYGPRAAKVPPPRLHAGSRLPEGVIAVAGDALSRTNLMPGKGYLE